MWNVMKKFPRIVQCDKRGQIVIPKEIRQELGIEEGTGFFMYSISDEGVLLKKIAPKELSNEDKVVSELKEKADKISLSKEKIDKAVKDYKKTKEGGLDLL
jgi:AbrB family looped-hinge helix DNA binding protein